MDSEQHIKSNKSNYIIRDKVLRNMVGYERLDNIKNIFKQINIHNLNEKTANNRNN